MPATAYAELRDGALDLRGMVADPDGKRMVKGGVSGPPAEAARLGETLAEKLLREGGEEILAGFAR